jgi:hypothetical protein
MSSFFIIFIIYIIFWLTIDSFYNNTIKYLKDEKLELNQNNFKKLVNGYIAFSVSVGINMLISLISYFKYCF